MKQAHLKKSGHHKFRINTGNAIIRFLFIPMKNFQPDTAMHLMCTGKISAFPAFTFWRKGLFGDYRSAA